MFVVLVVQESLHSITSVILTVCSRRPEFYVLVHVAISSIVSIMTVHEILQLGPVLPLRQPVHHVVRRALSSDQSQFSILAQKTNLKVRNLRPDSVQNLRQREVVFRFVLVLERRS